MTRADVVINARKLMKLSQSRLAESIGVSPKAVQSYEQGWRTVPNRFFSQLFVILAEFRNPTLGAQPCWGLKSCEKECEARQSRTGCCCWMLAATDCVMMNSDENNPVAEFVTCPVINRLLTIES